MHNIARIKELFPPAGKRLQFWWPLCICAMILGMLWTQVPFRLMLGPHPAAKPSLPSIPHTAYVTLDEEFATRAFHRIRSSWASDDQKGKIAFDIELSETANALPEPWQLTKTQEFSSEWRPAPITKMRIPDQDLMLPDTITAAKLPPIAETLHVNLSSALENAGFSFDRPEGDFAAVSGSIRFEVETDAEGRVAHLLSLSEPSADQRRLESAILRGRASGAASGFVTCEWHLTSTKNKEKKDGD